MKRKLKKFHDIIPSGPEPIGFGHLPFRATSQRENRIWWRLGVLALIASFGILSVIPMERTWSFYGDAEKSVGNILKAGSIDFSVSALEEGEGELIQSLSGTSYAKWAKIEKESTLDFQYRIDFEKIEETNDFCDSLVLEASLEGIPHYNGKLVDFISPVFDYSETMDEWKFLVTLSGDRRIRGVCNFQFVFSGWQTNAADFSVSAFGDQENSQLVAIENLLNFEPASEFETPPITIESFDTLNLSVDLGQSLAPTEALPTEPKEETDLNTAVSELPIDEVLLESQTENDVQKETQLGESPGSVVEPEASKSSEVIGEVSVESQQEVLLPAEVAPQLSE